MVIKRNCWEQTPGVLNPFLTQLALVSTEQKKAKEHGYLKAKDPEDLRTG